MSDTVLIYTLQKHDTGMTHTPLSLRVSSATGHAMRSFPLVAVYLSIQTFHKPKC